MLLTLFYFHELVIHASAQGSHQGVEDSRVQEPRQALCWFEGADGQVLPEAAWQLIVWLLQPLVPDHLAASLLLGEER